MHKIKSSIKHPEMIGLFVLVVLHTLASYFSYGFHHPDEHFQILEFANVWAGLAPDGSHLPWEYAAQIRPWFQPMIHGIVMKAAVALHCYNPFTLVFLFRLFYSGLNISGMWLLWQEFKKRYALNPLWFLGISSIWFLGYIHVRTSSENLCGIFLTFAVVLLLRGRNLFWVGGLLGFSFLARYQVALGIFGLGLYLLYRDRKITRNQLLLFCGFLIPVGLGVIFDRIGYGNWVFTPYRYFKVNLVDGVAATFNPYPWYEYFIWIGQLNPLVSIPLLAGVMLFTKRVWKDLPDEIGRALTSFVVAFFVLHLFITNKEYRFLFPILNLVPFMAAAGLRQYEERIFRRSVFGLYVFVNLIAFAVSTLHGASVETLWTMNTVNHYAAPGETWLSNRNYKAQFLEGYYRLPEHHVELFQDGETLEKLLVGRTKVKVLVDGHLQDTSTQSILAVIENHHCQMLSSARPALLFKLRTVFPGIDRLAFKALYECY